ncbi:MAG TPA: alpha/beta hydrolase [Gammaproteobacteria bacterium]|nr:alpha/beta hydrolase [Gammaproteobacteria bacterium]
MAYLAVRDLELWYELRGSGPPLLFIGGTGGDLRVKPNVFDSPLAGHFQLLAYDQRGLGRTRGPDRACGMADFADDAAALLDALGWEQCPVLGISFGGMVAQELALRHPHRVERLTLACTSSGGPGGASWPLHELAGLAPEERARRVVVLADTRRDAGWQRANPQTFRRLVEQRLAQERAGHGEAGLQRQLRARAGHDTWDRLPRLKLPVYVCGGRYDGIAPPANQEALAARIPGARLELFEGGHLFFLQDRDAYPRMRAFLRDAGEAAR